jgi:hypothetical protein
MNITTSTPVASRCQHRSHTGRQCRSIVTSPGSLLCARHVAALSTDSVDFSADLIRENEYFQEAQQINHSLIALYKLVAAGRISPRPASVLAYIAHLILTSHKAIDYDNKNKWRRRAADPSMRPVMLSLADIAGPGAEPLPATGEEFAAQVLTHSGHQG